MFVNRIERYCFNGHRFIVSKGFGHLFFGLNSSMKVAPPFPHDGCWSFIVIAVDVSPQLFVVIAVDVSSQLFVVIAVDVSSQLFFVIAVDVLPQPFVVTAVDVSP